MIYVLIRLLIQKLLPAKSYYWLLIIGDLAALYLWKILRLIGLIKIFIIRIRCSQEVERLFRFGLLSHSALILN